LIDSVDATNEVSVAGIDGYFDGGSLLFTLRTPSGKEILIVLSAERQRKDLRYSLSVPGRSIRLIPETYYQELAASLRRKIDAGIASGFQQNWPGFSKEASELSRLLGVDGYHEDLHALYVLEAERLKLAHEQHQAKPLPAVTPGDRAPVTRSP
jgi:hypothetical protein